MSRTALLVIDVQRIYTDPKSELSCARADKTLGNINKLVEQFELHELPIVLVRHIHKLDGSDLGRMFDYAGPAEDFNFKAGTSEVEYTPTLRRPKAAIEIAKTRYSAFADTHLDRILRDRGVDRVAICGFMTNFCCDSTAREAHDKDYFVDFVVDATGTPGTENMNQSRIRDAVSELLSSGYAQVFSTKQYLGQLAKRKTASA